jgi:hypothetical protein
VEHLKGASLGEAPALSANIRIGWKGLPEANTLAYYKNPQIMAVKGFIAQAPCHHWLSLKNVFYSSKFAKSFSCHYSEAVFLVVCDPSMNKL